jgi:transposase InsO family protein
VMAAEGYALTPRTIDRWIQREGWTRTDSAPAPALQRFTHAAPNDLWQMDAKGAYPLEHRQRCHTLSVLDDHSRFVVGLTPLLTLQTGVVRAALVRSFERYGVPTAMLMDHGAPWWSTQGPAGLTRLGVFLLKQGIRLVFGAVRHPQTQGKVERFHRTLAERLRWVGVRRRWRASGGRSPGFARNTTKCGRMRHWASSRRPCTFARAPGATASRRVRGIIPPASRSAESIHAASFVSLVTTTSCLKRSAGKTSPACHWRIASSSSIATCTCVSCIRDNAEASR